VLNLTTFSLQRVSPRTTAERSLYLNPIAIRWFYGRAMIDSKGNRAQAACFVLSENGSAGQ
jgi:hypothetical protein